MRGVKGLEKEESGKLRYRREMGDRRREWRGGERGKEEGRMRNVYGEYDTLSSRNAGSILTMRRFITVC